MNRTERIRLVVESCRAIRRADVSIGDITVLSGVNACGKSTIAHLAHVLVNCCASYDSLAQTFAFHKCDTMLTALTNVCRRVRMAAMRIGQGRDNLDERNLPYDVWLELTMQNGQMVEKLNWLDRQIDILFGFISRNEERPDVRRYKDALNVDLNVVGRLSTEDLRDYVKSQLVRIGDEYSSAVTSRTSKVLNFANESLLKWVKTSGDISMYEGETQLYVHTENPRATSEMGEILGLSKAVYVESPWRSIPIRHRNGDLTICDGLPMTPSKVPFAFDRELFSELQGTVSVPDDDAWMPMIGESSEWVYRREDGLEVRLDDCATGMKSLSVLNVLYERGLLDGRTLLIVDEPEAHLHPQWILEYAKILVRLNRQHGVRMLVTTHSPDMLNAIRRVANVAEVPDLRFYLAEECSPSDRFSFIYRDLGRNVMPIFQKFNLAADKTEAYPNDQ